MIDNVILIGAGELGSRHLQGLVKSKNKFDIHIVDVSEKSLNKAKKRAHEISVINKLIFHNNLKELPNKAKLVIVATNADVRANVVKRLVSRVDVEFMLLEKVLFQDINSYEEINELIRKRSIVCYVNHPRRMFQHYINIKEYLSNIKNRHYSIIGGNWGLACNGTHFIDLFTYLDNSVTKILSLNHLDNKLISSKRSGYIEVSGMIQGELSSGNTFSLISKAGRSYPSQIVITDENNHIIIRESFKPSIFHLKLDSESIIKHEIDTLTYQSDLTTIIIDKLISNKNIELPLFKSVLDDHLLFIDSLIKWYNKKNGTSSKRIQIT